MKGRLGLRVAERAGRLFKADPQQQPAPTASAVDISWADEFIRNVRPYIFVREEDNLLIKKPNQAHLLNEQGVSVLSFLLEGGTIAQLLERAGPEPQRAADIALFLYEVRRCLEGTLQESNHTSAVEVRPLELVFSKLPVLSEVAVTSRCNLRCVFCYGSCSYAGRPAGPKREMTTEEIERILHQIMHRAQAPSVSFTGGEPTMRPDLCRLIRYAKEVGLRVNLITNGTLVTRNVAEELARSGLDTAQVSLEGVTAGTHEAMTSVASSFDRTLAGIVNLKSCGIPVHTNTTLNRGNLNDCLQMPRFVREELDLDKFSMNLVIPTGTALINDDLLIRYSEVGPIVGEILDSSRRLGVEFMWYSPTPLCLFNPIIHALGNKGCGACDGLLSVDCEGNVLPCSSCEEPVGNLLTTDFDVIWKSGRAEAYRLKQLGHPECRTCDNFAACHGACPLYWRHFGFDELCKRKGFGQADRHSVLEGLPTTGEPQAAGKARES